MNLKVLSVHYTNKLEYDAAYYIYKKSRTKRSLNIRTTRIFYPGEYKRDGIHIVPIS